MPTVYTYELWNGREAVGTYTSRHPLVGQYISIPTVSELQCIYTKKYETIDVPIIIRQIKDDGVNIEWRRCLDVRRKSKRQLALIEDI